jgi:3-oxoacyl-ACP reductase-like protein
MLQLLNSFLLLRFVFAFQASPHEWGTGEDAPMVLDAPPPVPAAAAAAPSAAEAAAAVASEPPAAGAIKFQPSKCMHMQHVRVWLHSKYMRMQHYALLDSVPAI